MIKKVSISEAGRSEARKEEKKVKLVPKHLAV